MVNIKFSDQRHRGTVLFMESLLHKGDGDGDWQMNVCVTLIIIMIIKAKSKSESKSEKANLIYFLSPLLYNHQQHQDGK